MEQSSPKTSKDEEMSSAESDNSLSSDDSSDDTEESSSESSQSDSDTNSNDSDVSKASNRSVRQSDVVSTGKSCSNRFDGKLSPQQQQEDLIDGKCNRNSNNKDSDANDSSSVNHKTKHLNSKEDVKQILANFPDIVRRSSRSRKEPDRFQAEAYESEESDSPKSSRRQRKRKDSEEWNDGHDCDDRDEDELDYDEHGSDSSDQDSRSFNRRLRTKTRSKRISTSNRRHHIRSSGRATSRSIRNYTNSESDQDDDEDGDDDVDEDSNSFERTSNRKKTRRSINPVSYKEESDFTDSEDLIPMTDCAGDAMDSTTQVPLEEIEEEGEMIEKVLEHRMGRVGATGPKTASYHENGDPNTDLKDDEPKEIHFLIKWKGWSYIHCTWESKQSLAEQKARGVKKIELYLKRDEEVKIWKKTASPEDIDYYEGQEELNYQLRQLHLNVERIIAHQPSKIGVSDTCHPEYLCKWEGLPYSECTWEDGALINKLFKPKVNDYYQREKSQNIPMKYCRVLKQRPKFTQMKTQPSFIGGKDQLKLRDYQLDGLNWLAQSWCRDNSVILADEMGLGKTIQTISFLNYLYHQHSLFGPFLLVVPLSTLAAWQREFETWAPMMNVVVYIGDATSRHMIREYEWSHSGSQRIKFNVLLTTYEILLRDKEFLSSVPWAVLGVDEAHRLKNDESFLYKCLSSFDTNYRLLITGTPLQNSLRELWALLHFIMPSRFESWESFESEHKDAYQKGFSKLHSQLQQFLLRRVKKDVEKSLPAKVEQILRVDMTSIQKQYYKWILTKNYKALSKGVKGSVTSFTNIVMELKKCCNHASLVRPMDEYIHLDPLQRLIRGSGKLLLLDKLLCRLKETGHRVLIFSQMVRMLDLLGEYLSLRRFQYQRLDGSIRGEVRKQALEHFNAEGSQDFCFLLSTRAGGLGINLATADTVIIFDSDWNPQNDLQAQARAHRIGQKNQVNIYRLVTRNSVEEDIIERAKRKMVLDHLVIQRMDTSGHTVMRNSSLATENKSGSNTTPFNKEELGAILKFGAEDLFKETENGDEEPQCDIDEILKRAETREDDGPQTLGDELLNSFKVASFNFNEEEDVQAVSVSQDEQKEWDEIIPESERIKFEQDERQKEQMEMMLPRCRNKSKMSGNRSDSGEEYDPNAKNDSPGSDDSDSERPRRRGRPKSSYRELIKGFSEQEVRRFIKSYKKFPTPLKRLESIAIDAELQEKPLPDLQKLAIELEQNCHMVMKESEKDNSNELGSARKNNRGPSFKLGGVTVFAKSILTNQKELEPLDLMLPSDQEERKKWILTGIKVKSVNWDCQWTIENDSRLLAGVYEYGFGSWESIKMDPSYKLTEKILPDGELKPQAKQLQSRVEYLLKVMYRHLVSQRELKEEPALSSKSKIKRPKLDTIQSGTKSELESNSLLRKEKKKKTNLTDKNVIKKPRDKDKEKHKKKRKDKKDKRKEKKRHLSDSTNESNANITNTVDELTEEVFNECKEKMRAVKKALKALNRIDDHRHKLSKKTTEGAFYELLATIGAHIDSCLNECQHDTGKMRELRNNLWTFVSKFTEFPAKKLYKFYRRVKLKQENSEIEKSNRNDHSKGSVSHDSSVRNANFNSTSGNQHYHRNNNQYIRKDPRYSSGPTDHSLKRNDYYGSNVTGSSSATKFAKHSHHREYGRDYVQSPYHGGGNHYGWSSKHDSFRGNNNYDNNRYHSNKNYYSRNEHHRSDRSMDRYERRQIFNRTSSDYSSTNRNQIATSSMAHGSYGTIDSVNNNPATAGLNHITQTNTNHCWPTNVAALLPTPLSSNNHHTPPAPGSLAPPAPQSLSNVR